MTIQYSFNARPFSPGESREFTLTSSSPATVSIRCFVSSPPPPGYKPCAECGSFKLVQGQSTQIEASQYLFSRSRGGLEITVVDQDGDVVKIPIKVTADDPDAATIQITVAG
jgi:hypothetical protein